MRGRVQSQSSLFSYVNLEDRVRKHHPLRRIKAFCDQALAKMDEELTALYKRDGRPSIPPEQLLKASLLQMLYAIRSERDLVEQISFNMLYRWFLDMSLDEEVWVATVYSKNRDRLMTSEVARSFLSRLLEQATQMGMVSSEHFSVDGTLIHAWASTKSLVAIEDLPTDEKEPQEPKDDEPKSEDEETRDPPKGAAPRGRDELVDFRGKKFSNATHRSRTDCDARLVRKSFAHPVRFSYLASALMENRSGLVIDGEVRIAAGDGGETGAAKAMLYRLGGEQRITLGADKGYDSFDFVEELGDLEVVPHIARNATVFRRSAIPEEVAATPEYAVSIRVRKRIEEVFGWVKEDARLRQVRVRGKGAVDAVMLLAYSAFNLVRMNTILSRECPA